MTPPTPTPRELARVLVGMDYPRDEIVAAVRKHFPDSDVEQLVDQAVEEKSRFESEVDAEQAADETAAVEAEHNPETTMHRRQGQ